MGPLSLAFVLLPLLELMLLVRIGRAFGAGSTLLLVIASGLVGLVVAKIQGRRVLRAWQAALAEGRVPERGVLDGALILAGALLLITPGVITDVLGLVCLVPLTRHALAGRIERMLATRVASGQVRMDGFGFGFPQARPPSAPPPTARVGGIPRRGSRFGGRPQPARPRNDDIIDTEGEEV